MYNKIEKKVYDFIKENKLLEENEHVILGLSGGADSVCLLCILNSISAEMKFKITAVHINHLLRGEEAYRDERHVINLCENLGIDLKVERIKVRELAENRKISLEEAGREVRYRVFNSYLDKLNATKIAVAHNKNDLVETILMNIIRGTGLEGLKGIEYINGNLVRPIMILNRDEIEEYCNANNIEYIVDSSNLEQTFTRNKIRLKLIREINDLFNVDIVSKIGQMSKLLKEDNTFIEKSTQKAYIDCKVGYHKGLLQLDIKKVTSLDIAIQRRILRIAISEIKKDINNIEYKHIEMILNLINDGKTGSVIQLPCKVRVLKEYNMLKFFLEDSNLKTDSFIEIEARIPGECELDNKYFIKLEIIDKSTFHSEDSSAGNTQYFDYNKIGNNVVIRNRREGDIFKPRNSDGTKKLKKYFIDKKIPKEDRSNLLLITRGKEVIWIIGDKISDNFAVSEQTNKIVKITYNSL